MESRYHVTSRMVQRCINRINQDAPINLEFATLPVCRVLINHIELFESIYAKSRLFRFLIHLGVHPTLLFAAVTSGLAVALRRSYRRSASLTLDILSVTYPAWRSWQLAKSPDMVPEHALELLQEQKAWITYWILFGLLRVLDHSTTSLLFYLPNYRVYKALFLYWAQNPRSWGADLICRHVLQKPTRIAHSPPPPTPPELFPAKVTTINAELSGIDTHWSTATTDYHRASSRSSDSSEISDSHPDGSLTKPSKLYPHLVTNDLFRNDTVSRTILY